MLNVEVTGSVIRKRLDRLVCFGKVVRSKSLFSEMNMAAQVRSAKLPLNELINILCHNVQHCIWEKTKQKAITNTACQYNHLVSLVKKGDIEKMLGVFLPPDLGTMQSTSQPRSPLCTTVF